MEAHQFVRGRCIVHRREGTYGGSPIKLLAHLVEQRRMSDKELERMRELLQQPKRKRGR